VFEAWQLFWSLSCRNGFATCIYYILVYDRYVSDSDRIDDSGIIQYCSCGQAPVEGAGMNPARVIGPAVISGYFQNAENSVLTHAVSII